MKRGGSAGAARFSEAWLADRQARKHPAVKDEQAARVRERIRLVLPFPPSQNHTGADGRRGGRKTEAYHAFMSAVDKLVLEAGRPMLLSGARIGVTVDVVPPDNRDHDFDNIEKHLWDALQQAGVYEKDALIDDKHVRRMPVLLPGNGSVVVNLWRL